MTTALIQNRRLGLLACGALVTLLSGCDSSGTGSISPLAPGPPQAGSLPPSPTGINISGTVSSASSVGARPPSGGMIVSVAGTSLSSPVGADGTFSLSGVPAGDLQLTFSGGGDTAVLGLLNIRQGEVVRIAVTIVGSTAILQSETRGIGAEAEARGAVARLGGSCPTLTFTVADQAVQTTINTRFDLACGAVQAGTRVEVKGTRRQDGSLLARLVRPV
jgi:hypothetical protein